MAVLIRFALAISCVAFANAQVTQSGRGKLQSAEAEKAQPAAAPKPRAGRAVRLAMRDGLRFDPPRFSAAPGELLEVEIENADATNQQHNFLLIRPGKREAVVNEANALGEAGPARAFVPQDSNIILNSALLEPEKLQTITFSAPAEQGVYPYVCTFPGHGVVMYGALYVGTPMPPLDKDENLPPVAAAGFVVGRGKRPFIQRMFMPQCGPAAIAVALPGEQNYCWDAGQCRLRYVWRGAFIDATDHWRGKGGDLARLPQEPWWRAPEDEFPLRFASANAPMPEAKFLGYQIAAGIPEFHYRVGDAEVFEKVTATERGIAVDYRVPAATEELYIRAPAAANAFWQSSVGEWKDGILRVSPAQAANVTLTLAMPDSKAAP